MKESSMQVCVHMWWYYRVFFNYKMDWLTSSVKLAMQQGPLYLTTHKLPKQSILQVLC